jgi:hypothetical protein
MPIVIFVVVDVRAGCMMSNEITQRCNEWRDILAVATARQALSHNHPTMDVHIDCSS